MAGDDLEFIALSSYVRSATGGRKLIAVTSQTRIASLSVGSDVRTELSNFGSAGALAAILPSALANDGVANIRIAAIVIPSFMMTTQKRTTNVSGGIISKLSATTAHNARSSSP